MKRCPKCYAEVENNFDMCWNCQYSFVDDKVLQNDNFKLICPKCNAEIESELNYCTRCHFDLRETKKENVDDLESEIKRIEDSKSQHLYEVLPDKVDLITNYKGTHPMSANSSEFITWVIIIEVIAIIAALIWGGTFWILGLVVIAIFFAIRKSNNESKDEEETKRINNSLKMRAKSEASFYTQKMNLILSNSKEIVEQILPYFENLARQSIDSAKTEFAENAYSPFWSEIEKASKSLAYYKEAINQLCVNSEIYSFTLKGKNHNFPIPFPFATNISISQVVIDDYKNVIRKAQTNATFSIIWEQRRNSEILIAGFTTLENTIRNMSNELLSAINDLNYTINSELTAIKHIQKEQLLTFEKSQIYLNQTLKSIDNKLYYIEWNRRPPGMFYYR